MHVWVFKGAYVKLPEKGRSRLPLARDRFDENGFEKKCWIMRVTSKHCIV